MPRAATSLGGRTSPVRLWGWCGTVLMAVSLLTLPCPAWAGQGQEASIVGQVTDESGAILPGVTVTATSPSLQVTDVVSISNERGEYRLSPLPIGTYEVTYTLSGFQTARQENIRLTVGFTAKLDMVLKVGSLNESVTVSGTAPVVDVTSTGSSTQLTRETLELVPTTRNGLASLMAQAPAARGVLDVGGSNFAAIPTYTVYGQTGQQWNTLEGVFAGDPSGGGAGNYYDYTTFEETNVQTLGKSAAVPVRGVQIDAIVKSGGNNFHGNAFYSGVFQSLQGGNLDSALQAQGLTGANNIEKRYDISGELGGHLIRNKLWFFGSARNRQDSVDIPGVFQDGAQTIQATRDQGQKFETGKLSYQMTTGNRFIGFIQHAAKTELAGSVDIYTPWSTRRSGLIPTGTRKVQWQGIKSNFVASLQWGFYYWQADYKGFEDDAVMTTDLVTLQYRGEIQSTASIYRPWRHHVNGTAGWYKSTSSWGNHEIRTGFDLMPEQYVLGQRSIGAGDYLLQLQRGVAFQVQTFNRPTFPIERDKYFGAYATDNWTIARRVTLNLGARWVHDNAYVPAQCRQSGTFAAAGCADKIQFSIWKSLAPRLSAAYDMTGSGRTVIKGGWGRYDNMRTMNSIVNANRFGNVTTTWRWHDNNGNALWDPGEVNLDPSGLDFVGISGASTLLPDPHEPQPKEDQYHLSFEQQLVGNMAVRASGIYTRYFNVPWLVGVLRPYDAYNVPITKAIPGPDGAVPADNRYGTITYYEYPTNYVGSQFDQTTLTSPSGLPDQSFKTLELTGTKRLSKGWQFFASYSATKKNIVPAPESSVYNPNTLINAADRTWEYITRISGAYFFPLGITGSMNLESINGLRLAPQALFTGGKTITSIVLNTAPIGTIQLPSTTHLDLRVEKNFAMFKGHKLTARLNIYNVLNANTVTAETVRLGANYLKPTAILPPRIGEVGVSYSF